MNAAIIPSIGSNDWDRITLEDSIERTQSVRKSPTFYDCPKTSYVPPRKKWSPRAGISDEERARRSAKKKQAKKNRMRNNRHG